MPRKTKSETSTEQETLQTEGKSAEIMENPSEIPELVEDAKAPEIAGYLPRLTDDLPSEKTPATELADAPENTNELTPAEETQLAPIEAKPARAPRKSSFFRTDFKGLDRDLSPEQLQEWNSIYASFRSKSILTGTVIGVDDNRFEVTNPETGKRESKSVRSLVIIGYRVKVLVPETEVWESGEERPDYVMRGMVGATVDYVVMQVDREGDCAIASRRMALIKRRRHFLSTRGGHESGENLSCNVLVVGPRRVLVECGGYDISLPQRDLSWTMIADLRDEYRPGQVLSCKLKELNPAENRLLISVRDVNPNPFEGAENRHPVGCRRQALISGKYAGGVFCNMSDGTTCLCLYSNMLGDDGFFIGDSVLVHITQYDYPRRLIYGRIITKW